MEKKIHLLSSLLAFLIGLILIYFGKVNLPLTNFEGVLLDKSIDISGILLGFLITLKGILLTLNSKSVMMFLKQSGNVNSLNSYLSQAVTYCAVLLFVSLYLLIFDTQLLFPTFKFYNEFDFLIWFVTLALMISSSARFIYLFLKIINIQSE